MNGMDPKLGGKLPPAVRVAGFGKHPAWSDHIEHLGTIENIAKAIIFLPMAISLVGAGVIWKFIPENDQPPRLTKNSKRSPASACVNQGDYSIYGCLRVLDLFNLITASSMNSASQDFPRHLDALRERRKAEAEIEGLLLSGSSQSR